VYADLRFIFPLLDAYSSAFQGFKDIHQVALWRW